VTKRGLTPFLAGVAAVAAFSWPQALPLLLASLAVLIHLWARADSPRAAFAAGWWWGFGFFGAGVSWVYISMSRFGGMPAPLAAIATLGFCAFLALFPALAGWLQSRLRAPLAIAALWVLLEWLRAWVFTGFPWLSLGYAAVDSPLAGYAPLGGVFLLSFLVLACAGLLYAIAIGRARWPAACAFAAIGIAGWALQTVEWSQPAGAPFAASLAQGNVAQDLKFDPARYARTLDTYARLAEGSRARLIVLPETALPRFLDQVDPADLARLEAAAKANGGDLLLGAPLRSGPETYHNSVVSLGASPRQAYHKTHLVPFGEFIPPGFGWVNRILAFPLSDFTPGGAAQRPLAVAGERVAVNICYEDAFGAEIRRMLPEATLLVNVSNVAWFGDSLAPGQHLQIARMRALETSRMLLAATNSGITAAIDRDGQVLARLPAFTEGRLDVTARGYSGATPYVRLGDWPALGVCLLAVAFVALRARSR
jgi:apolipoprotein N-acyltransferase